MTPWGSRLSSTEYEADARRTAPCKHRIAGKTAALARYDGGDVTRLKPYACGWPVEVTVDAEGGTQVAKRYAMGRVALELTHVMQERRTAYLTDDGTNDFCLNIHGFGCPMSVVQHPSGESDQDKLIPGSGDIAPSARSRRGGSLVNPAASGTWHPHS